ncbi:MAG: hypothetical protein JWQ64_1759 [Subtercola sp.]|jgi:LacI family transcriptional regulator|nr:hypothetical protein [Subtercola sp.]
MATLKDVAEATNLGLATVSRALSGNAGVLPETRKKVEAAAKALGYQPNALARGLRQSSSKAVGLVIPDLENEFYTSGAAVIQEVLANAGYRLILCCSNNDPTIDALLLDSLVERRVEAIAHVPSSAIGSDVIRSRNPSLPVVEYARRSNSEHVDSIVGDEALGSEKLIEYLVSLGHRRIAMIAGPRGQSTTTARLAGFESAVRKAGLDADQCPVLHGPYDPDWSEDATRELLLQDPQITAIFASSSRTVLGAFKALSGFGLHVPSDISLVGFLNPPWYEVALAPVTTYELPLKDMGAMAADLLLKRIAENEHPHAEWAAKTIRFEGRLIVRESATAPRVGSLELAEMPRAS